ncbi:hypothetical protein HPT27_06515 [Permianibacter sp. IMCC34836]|uniref:hypothetical protein n=1 Tax=Permianibacter fluminis TaxID=2738515 RepID=UPI001553239B|nr:hypothetical protein [Permianibacter fluminis]NQD36672.1 hypothetical protein [Permianibacter fluminis]
MKKVIGKMVRSLNLTVAGLLLLCVLVGESRAADVRSTTPLSAIPVERSVIIDLPMAGELMPAAKVSMTDSWMTFELHAATVAESDGYYATRFTLFKGLKLVVTDIEYINLSASAPYANSLSLSLFSEGKTPNTIQVYRSHFDDAQRVNVRERLVSPIVIPEYAGVMLRTKGAITGIRLRGYLIDDGMGFGFKSAAD